MGIDLRVKHVQVLDSHVTSSQGGSLASKDIDNLASSFKGLQSSDEEVLLFEDIHREGHGHGDGKRHTLWDANDEEGDCNESILSHPVEVLWLDELDVREGSCQEPDDTKDYEGTPGNDLCPGSNDLRKSVKLLHELSLLFWNSEFLITLIPCAKLNLSESALTNTENNSLSTASHDKGVLEENWVRVLLVFLCILVRALLLDSVLSLKLDVVHALVNEHVHLFNEKTVSWNLVSGLQEDDVTNDKLRGEDSLGGSRLASQNSDLLVLNLTCQSEELLLLTPITKGLDEASEGHSKVD